MSLWPHFFGPPCMRNCAAAFSYCDGRCNKVSTTWKTKLYLSYWGLGCAESGNETINHYLITTIVPDCQLGQFEPELQSNMIITGSVIIISYSLTVNKKMSPLVSNLTD